MMAAVDRCGSFPKAYRRRRLCETTSTGHWRRAVVFGHSSRNLIEDHLHPFNIRVVVLDKTLSRIPVACAVFVPENHGVGSADVPDTLGTHQTQLFLDGLLTTRQRHTASEESEINVGAREHKAGVKLEEEFEIKDCPVEGD